MTKTIKITCEGADLIDVNALEHFQDQFKTLTKEQATAIRESIIVYGFTFPVYIWKNSKGGKKIIDGHQRAAVLKEMLKEGFELEGGKIPVAR